MYVAVENLRDQRSSRRWLLTFAFGLVHGFGFANVLSDLELPTHGLVLSLVSFNLGVELGQLAVVLVLAPFSVWLARQKFAFKAQFALSSAIFLSSCVWFVQRL